MDKLLEQIVNNLIQARTSSSPQAYLQQVENLLISHQNDLRLELASEAHDLYEKSFYEGEAILAWAAAYVASRIYLIIGRRSEALKNYLNAAEVNFAASNSENEYKSVRDDALQILSLAKEARYEDTGFDAAVLAADCSYFASKSKSSYESEIQWMFTALDDLIISAGHKDICTKTVYFARFVSLVVSASK